MIGNDLELFDRFVTYNSADGSYPRTVYVNTSVELTNHF